MIDTGTNAARTSIVVPAVVGLLILGSVTAVAVPAYGTLTIKPRVGAVVQTGYEIAEVAGKQWARTGKPPANADVQLIAERVPHPSEYLRGVDIDPASGVLTLDVAASATTSGKIRLFPEAENGHFYWNCATDDLQAYAPYTCRARTGSGR